MRIFAKDAASSTHTGITSFRPNKKTDKSNKKTESQNTPKNRKTKTYPKSSCAYIIVVKKRIKPKRTAEK
jgi:hypothetical protein